MITIVGVGAVGVTLASYLTAAGRPVRLYVRAKDRPAFEKAGALLLDRPRQASLVAPLPPLTEKLIDADTRYLIIATKFGSLPSLLDGLSEVSTSLTLVATLNGVRTLPYLRQKLPGVKAAALTIMFNAQHCGPLHAQLTTKPAVILASEDPQLHQLLSGTGLKLSRAQGEEACWGKLLINLANSIGALTDSTFRDLLSHPDLRVVMAAALAEAVDRIEAAQINFRLPMPLPYRAYHMLLLHGGPLPWWLAQLKNGLDDGAYPSMVADLRAGRETEVRQLNGEIVALGEQLHWPAPINQTLMDLIEAVDRDKPEAISPADLRRRVLG